MPEHVHEWGFGYRSDGNYNLPGASTPGFYCTHKECGYDSGSWLSLAEAEARLNEYAALKREPIWTGKRIEIRRGDNWLREGRKGTAVGEPVFVLQNWLPVLWDDEEDPTFSKLGAIALLKEPE